MAKPDLELLRLEEVLRLARERLALIILQVGDPAVIKAAETSVQKPRQRSPHIEGNCGRSTA